MIKWLSELPLSVQYRRLLRAAGFMTWIYAYLIVLLIAQPGHLLPPKGGIGWLIAWLAVLPTFWLSTSDSQRIAPVRLSLMTLELVATFAMRWQEPRISIAMILLLITWQAVIYYPVRQALQWMLVLFSLYCVVLHHEGKFTWIPIVGAVVYLLFKMLTCGLIVAALREADARSKQTAVIADLNLRQALLVETSRSAERLRISRDLHDALGHGLTALSLHLEVALNNSPSDSITPQLHKAKSVTKRMLSDVRRVVGELREAAPDYSLSDAISELVADIPGLNIHLSAPTDIPLENEEQAVASIRCVQEIITNTLKHANAQNLWVTLELEDGVLSISSHDDGEGESTARGEGLGITGMRERFRHLGGDVSVQSGQNGYSINAFIPLAQGG